MEDHPNSILVCRRKDDTWSSVLAAKLRQIDHWVCFSSHPSHSDAWSRIIPPLFVHDYRDPSASTFKQILQFQERRHTLSQHKLPVGIILDDTVTHYLPDFAVNRRHHEANFARWGVTMFIVPQTLSAETLQQQLEHIQPRAGFENT